ncbi:phenylacetic acid degradation protein PaaY [Vibrio galatheae]|uniref:Phenylacetic acid degradation protein PaaY n=1 Tax=Vibrio galatheae TaxID=579748 RepID=A0A0F4NL58_9VIBR|nr:DapH/DapD/GlmU-related protein [Vibrio galatheae]KJY82771.1 phenylacetic acid degradation protein PaaY [Vibrio galatheae]
MPIYQFADVIPVIHPSAFVHPSAEIIGDVIIEANVYIGPNAVLRGDFGRLIVCHGANVQDNCVMHGFPGKETVLEQNVHVGHGAIIHGCHIDENCLIGMNAVVMDLARIGKESIIGANSFVKTNAHFEPRSMIMGSPARFIREVTADELLWKERGTSMYHKLSARCHRELKLVEPLTEVEANRPEVSWSESHSTKREALHGESEC